MYRPDELLMLVVDQETDNLFRLASVPMTSNNSSIPIEFKSSTMNMSSSTSTNSPSKSADTYASEKNAVASVYSNPSNISFAPTSTSSLNTITNNKTTETIEASSSKPRENHGYTSSYTQTNSQPYSYAQSSTSGPVTRARNGYATSRRMGGHHHEGDESSSVDEISININLSNENFYSNSSFNSTSASAASNDDAELVTFV